MERNPRVQLGMVPLKAVEGDRNLALSGVRLGLVLALLVARRMLSSAKLRMEFILF